MDTPVQVALVSGLLVGTIPASIGAWLSSRRTADRIGNGDQPTNDLVGQVLNTQAQLLEGQARQDRQLCRMGEQITNCEIELTAVHKRLDDEGVK